MDQKAKKERRRAERINIPLNIRYRLKRSKTSFKEAALENISGLGLSLSIREPLMINDKIEVSIDVGKNLKPLSVLCKVRWCKKLSKSEFRAGIKFIKIKDPTLFTEFLCEKIVDLFAIHR